MKWIFKIVLLSQFLLMANAYTREIILIENISNLEDGEIVKKILQNKFYLPEKFITLKSDLKKCTKNTDSILHLCVTGPTDFKIIHMNRYVLNNALGSFKELGGENE